LRKENKKYRNRGAAPLISYFEKGMDRIGVKYCGGCNPHIDRVGLVQEIEKLLPDCRLDAEGFADQWEKAVLVCGCPISCADRSEVRDMARHWIHVGGATVDRETVPEERMADVIAAKIMALKVK